MNYQELSIKKLEKENKKLFSLVKKEYNYDCVIFIAKGSFLIGKSLSDLANVPLLEIFATRKGGKLKKTLNPILKIIPEKLKIYLRKKEMNSNVHSKNSGREIKYDVEKWKKYKKTKKILVVDDSIDTGYSALLVKEVISKFFSKSDIKFAVINYFEKASDVFKPDFYLYKNTMIKGPWSNDSKENKKFLKMYYEWRKNY